MINVLIAIRLWGKKCSNTCIVVHCDNAAVVTVIKNHNTKDDYLGACMHNLWLTLSTYNIDLIAKHISGKDNIIADKLSRWFDNTTNDKVKKYLNTKFRWHHICSKLFKLDWRI